MKLAILYTAFRQFSELDYQQQMFNRLLPWSRSLSIIYHCNNSGLSRSSIVEKLFKIQCLSMDFIYSPEKNESRYPYGQFEAICDVWERLTSGFDWVIHLHPDVFIVNQEPLLAAIKRADAENADILVTPIFGLRHPSYATDFFAFRPERLNRSIFESYRYLNTTDIIVPLENLFFIELHRAQHRHLVAHRFAHGQYHRDIDLLGLWHEHDLQRVKLFLKSSQSRWLPTCMRCLKRPYMATRFGLNWLDRKLKGIAQDGLAQQLTAL